jgi:hypothetical protein
VHEGEAADETARTHRADAVTVGSDVYFREDRFDPRDPAGFALLVHEATHVVERFRPGASWRRATPGAAAAEENLARTREMSVRPGPRPSADRYLLPPAPAAPTPTAGPAAPTPTAPAVARHAAPAARPMAAATDRPTAPAAQPQAAAVDVEALRGRIVRDLMRQLRDEFERGG